MAGRKRSDSLSAPHNFIPLALKYNKVELPPLNNGKKQNNYSHSLNLTDGVKKIKSFIKMKYM